MANLNHEEVVAAATEKVPNRVALCQFQVTESKEENHATARAYLKRAADAGASMAILPEIWNSPYATSAFSEYAEPLPSFGINESHENSPSATLLREAAREWGMTIVGGSIPEVDDEGKLYNTCLVYDKTGTLLAKHRKVHLFDINVPGGITFRESDTLSPGTTLTAFDAGEPFGMVGLGIWYVHTGTYLLTYLSFLFLI
jgi:omega-amidase